MRKNKTKKNKTAKGDGGKALRELFSPPAWKVKVSAEKRSEFTREFQSRLDKRILDVFGTYPTESAKVAQSVVQHAYHTLFGML